MKIDKSLLAFGTPKIIRDRDYLDDIRANQTCVLTHQPYPDPSHIRWGLGGGAGFKPSDNRVLPLAHILHVKSGQGRGEVAFWREHVTDELLMGALIALAEKRYCEYCARKSATR